MRHFFRWFLLAAMALLARTLAHADELERLNRGGDPFFQISQAVPHCPIPLGPLQTEQEWVGETHQRIERGNSCWWEGRCRLPNGYLYDKEIAETVRRRLANIEPVLHWQAQSTLWLMLQRRFVYVQGCVMPGLDKARFLAELARTADVERIIDETTTGPCGDVPYKTLPEPLAAATC